MKIWPAVATQKAEQPKEEEAEEELIPLSYDTKTSFYPLTSGFYLYWERVQFIHSQMKLFCSSHWYLSGQDFFNSKGPQTDHWIMVPREGAGVLCQSSKCWFWWDVQQRATRAAFHTWQHRRKLAWTEGTAISSSWMEKRESWIPWAAMNM